MMVLPVLAPRSTFASLCVALLSLPLAGSGYSQSAEGALDDIDPGEPVVSRPSQPQAAAPLIAMPVNPEEEAIRKQVGAVFPSDRHYRETAIAAIAQVYSQRDARPLWEESPLPPVSQRALGEALKRHAMPELMALDPETLVAAISEGPVAARDLANTVAFCDAALLVRLGAVPATKIWPDWDSQDKPGSDNRTVESIVPDLLTATALRPFEMEKAIDLMGPQNWIYRELLKAYPAAREAILQYSGLPQIPDPEQIGAGKPGELYPAAPAIAAHLIDKGYLKMAPELAPTITSMTPELTTALIAFQNDFGLDADGIFGQTSWRYLNTNAANHFRSIVLNLHRARLMPGKLGDRYLIANLPCAELHLFDANDFHSQSMRVVHGRADKESHHTKIFRDRMQEVVFGPYWNVPPSIAAKELLPKMQEDWGYLSRNDYELVTSFGASAGGRMSPDMLQAVAQGKVLIRQKPGNNNALGYVKFLFPNSFNIYMHDTPSKSFFARANRDFSHGCIRVAKPDELAAWIFAPEGWTLERVRNSMKNDLNKGVAVKGGINVYITYFTLFPRPVRDGRILLAPGRDVYGLDAVNAKTLAAVLPWKE